MDKLEKEIDRLNTKPLQMAWRERDEAVRGRDKAREEIFLLKNKLFDIEKELKVAKMRIEELRKDPANL